MRAINNVTMTVIKGSDQVYPGGCGQSIPCDHEKLGVVWLTTQLWERASGMEQPGLEVPAGTAQDTVANVEVVKIKVHDGRGFMFIDKASYDANIAQCNECCVTPAP